MTSDDNIIIHRSKKRKKTIQATYKDNAIHIYLPASLSNKEEEQWISTMTEKVKKRHKKPPLLQNKKSFLSFNVLLSKSKSL